MSTRRPNILMLVADDHQAGAMGWCRPGEVRTPVLDGLAARGTAFTRAYHMGGRDAAVCIPTRASLLTGMDFFHALKGGRDVIDPDHVTLPQWFRQAGYHAFGVGKWHNDKASLARSFDDGAALFRGGMYDHYATPLQPFDPSGVFPPEAETIGEGFSTHLFTDAACAFLRGDDQDRPFFLYTAFTAPHDPRTPPPAFVDMYRPDDIPLSPNFMPQHPFDHGTSDIRDEVLAPYPRTPERIRTELAEYYGMISSLDAGIGRILDTLEETGQSENTVVVYTGDHGLAVGQHGLMGKQNVYEHSARVPCMIAGPGIPRGRRVDAPIYSWDLYPTFCDLAGLDVPGGLDARSLTPLLSGTRRSVRDTVYTMYMDDQQMVTDGRWKLIRCAVDGIPHLQLFDLDQDPWELCNLADNASAANHLRRLSDAMDDYRHLMR